MLVFFFLTSPPSKQKIRAEMFITEIGERFLQTRALPIEPKNKYLGLGDVSRNLKMDTILRDTSDGLGFV